MGMYQDIWCCVGLPLQIELHVNLPNHEVPKVEGALRVHDGEDSDGCGFPSANAIFCYIAAMLPFQHELVCESFLIYSFLEVGQDLVVEDMFLGLMPVFFNRLSNTL